MAFEDLNDFLVVKPKTLPVGGKLYEFPGAVSGEVWLQMQALSEQLQRAQRAAAQGKDYDPDAQALSDVDETAMRKEVLADGEAEMIADGLNSTQIGTVFQTLIFWHLSGEETAERVWRAGGEVPTPNRAARRKKTPAKSIQSPASQDGSTVPKETEEAGEKSSSIGT